MGKGSAATFHACQAMLPFLYPFSRQNSHSSEKKRETPNRPAEQSISSPQNKRKSNPPKLLTSSWSSCRSRKTFTFCHTIFQKFCTEKHRQNEPKNSQKTAHFKLFWFFFQNCPYDLHEVFYAIFCQSFYTILESYICSDIKIVWLGSEKEPKLDQKWQWSM